MPLDPGQEEPASSPQSAHTAHLRPDPNTAGASPRPHNKCYHAHGHRDTEACTRTGAPIVAPQACIRNGAPCTVTYTKQSPPSMHTEQNPQSMHTSRGTMLSDLHRTKPPSVHTEQNPEACKRNGGPTLRTHASRCGATTPDGDTAGAAAPATPCTGSATCAPHAG
jgi:hypothetical protein